MKSAMSTFFALILTGALVAAPPPPRPPPVWVEDAATQLLAKAMVEEARARTGKPDAKPEKQDLSRALARTLDDVDNLMLLSGLMPLRGATSSPGPSTPSSAP
jgi:hypothetical protein